MIASNLLFVAKAAHSFSNEPNRICDLVSEGNLALLEALERFDPSMGFKLITFASQDIHGRMCKFISKHSNLGAFHLSARDRDNFRKVKGFIEEYSALNNSKPSSKQIQEKFGFTQFYADLYIEMIQSKAAKVSIPDPDDDELETFSSGQVEDESAPNPALQSQSADICKVIVLVVNQLPMRERMVLKKRFGLDGENESTLEEIGNQLELTRERVRQIEYEAKKTIKQKFGTRLS